MFDQIRELVGKNQVATAVAAALGAVMLYAAYDGGGGSAVGGGNGGWSAPGAGGEHQVMDRHGFDRPVLALTIQVPQGWQAQSEVRWDNVNGQCSTNIASPHIVLRSSDGREQIEVLPGFLAVTDPQTIRNRGSQPGDFCVVAMADSGEAMLRAVILPRLRSGAQLQRINPVPLTPEQQQNQTRLESLAQSSGGQMRANVYSLEAWLSHPDGTAEVLAISGFVFAGQQLIAGVPPLVSNYNDSILSVRSSPDRLQVLLQTARGIVANAQFDPDWRRNIEDMQRTVTAPAQPGRGPVVAGRGGSGGGGGGFDMDRWREDQRRDDEAQRRRIDSIREVERCYDPETGRTYEVSIHVGC